MRLLLAALLLVAIVAQTKWTSVTFKNYSDRQCQTSVNQTVRKIGLCIKEERPGHWRKLACTADGKMVNDTEYSDAGCTKKVFEHDIPTDKCHPGPTNSIMLECTTTEKFDHIDHSWTEADIVPTKWDWEVEAEEKAFNNETSKCISRADVMNRVVAKANGQYCECVCPHLAPWRCDCSGIASYGWQLAAPGHVTQTLPGVSTRLSGWEKMGAGDIILKPSQHVEVFRSWSGSTFAYCGCHNTADGCSCRTGATTSYWQSNGYYPAKGNMVC
jgi:hypothetical protein